MTRRPVTQLLVLRPKFRPRLRSELGVQGAAGGRVHREGLRLAARAVQGQHQQGLGPFAQRMLGGEGAQPGDRVTHRIDLSAQLHHTAEEFLLSGDVQFGEPVALPLGVRTGQSGQRYALRERQRTPQLFVRARGVARPRIRRAAPSRSSKPAASSASPGTRKA